VKQKPWRIVMGLLEAVEGLFLGILALGTLLLLVGAIK
jgi:hypothetical protein